jgi:hypothetical protein
MEGNVRKLIEIAQEKLGIRFVKQLFTVLLLIFYVDKKTVTVHRCNHGREYNSGLQQRWRRKIIQTGIDAII